MKQVIVNTLTTSLFSPCKKATHRHRTSRVARIRIRMERLDHKSNQSRADRTNQQLAVAILLEKLHAIFKRLKLFVAWHEGWFTKWHLCKKFPLTWKVPLFCNFFVNQWIVML